MPRSTLLWEPMVLNGETEYLAKTTHGSVRVVNTCGADWRNRVGKNSETGGCAKVWLQVLNAGGTWDFVVGEDFMQRGLPTLCPKGDIGTVGAEAAACEKSRDLAVANMKEYAERVYEPKAAGPVILLPAKTTVKEVAAAAGGAAAALGRAVLVRTPRGGEVAVDGAEGCVRVAAEKLAAIEFQ